MHPRENIPANAPTRYAIAFNGLVLGFSERRTKEALMKCARANAAFILDRVKGDAPIRYSKEGGFHFGSVNVRFNGETERTLRTMINERNAKIVLPS